MPSLESEITQSVNLIVSHVKETITNNLIEYSRSNSLPLDTSQLQKIMSVIDSSASEALSNSHVQLNGLIKRVKAVNEGG